ncbi:DNA-binding transcriptional LysR family regulator OS=Castellaniella defragrans OX=75697 GN=HNR28_003415 PE=3 SV=1 [Castellaniella defragrans]
MGGTVALPRVLKALAGQASGIRIEPVAVGPAAVGGQVERGELDLAWGDFGDLGASLYQQTLYRRPLIGIWRKGRGTVIDHEQFMSALHVVASVTSRANELLGALFKKRGHELRTGLVCPYVLAIPAIVAHSDYVAVVPKELARLFARVAEIETFSLPLKIPDLVIKQHWHARYHDDPAHRWFRSFVFDTLSEDEA